MELVNDFDKDLIVDSVQYLKGAELLQENGWLDTDYNTLEIMLKDNFAIVPTCDEENERTSYLIKYGVNYLSEAILLEENGWTSEKVKRLEELKSLVIVPVQ